MHRHHHRPTRRARLVGGALLSLALPLAVVSCGSDDSAGTAAEVSATEHNDADVAFATDMIQHHAQAMAMVDLTLDRPLDRPVQRIAEDVRAAQAPEIELMADWLVDWGEEVPATMNDHGNAGHGDGAVSESMEGLDHDMPGMMSPEQMDALQDAPDAVFQDLWLQMMVEHHEGAIEMAQAQQQDGRYQAAVELAAAIEDTQRAEVDAMRALLG